MVTPAAGLGWKVTPSDAALLERMARRLVEASTIAAGQRISRGANTTGRALLAPGVNTPEVAIYPAFWIRDPAWIAETGLVPAEEVWGWLTLMTETMQGPEPRRLASGGVVLPYSIADHINVDGSPVYYPGTYAPDDTQGPPWGRYPPHDDQYWLVFTADAYVKLTGDIRALTRTVPTPMGGLPLWQVCALAHGAFPIEGETQLCVASGDLDEHIVDWGYNDSVTKTGRLLFPSLLRLESASTLRSWFERLDRPDTASVYRDQAVSLRRSISETFYREGSNGEGWLISATGVGDKPDVWGSAYALFSGAVPGDVALAIGRWLLRGYRERTTVQHGQVRHIPTTDGFWELAQAEPGRYQNGAFWGYPAGWYIYALSLVDGQAAGEMFGEYLGYLRATWNDDLRACAWECINPDLDHYQNPGYLATVAMPYAALKQKGLLGYSASPRADQPPRDGR